MVPQTDKSSTLSDEDNSAGLPAKKGGHSPGFSAVRAKPVAALARENQTLSVLPRPVPRGSSFRNVLYYQNRFLVVDITPSNPSLISGKCRLQPVSQTSVVDSAICHKGGSVFRPLAQASEAGADDKSYATAANDFDAASSHQMACTAAAAAQIESAAGIAADDAIWRGKVGPRSLTMDTTPVTMDGRAIEIMVSDETGVTHRPAESPKVSRKRALLKRIGTALLDNRMKGRQNCEHLLTENPEEYRVLKKVLNIMFVTVGVALLLSVFVVIAYTTIGKFVCCNKIFIYAWI